MCSGKCWAWQIVNDKQSWLFCICCFELLSVVVSFWLCFLFFWMLSSFKSILNFFDKFSNSTIRLRALSSQKPLWRNYVVIITKNAFTWLNVYSHYITITFLIAKKSFCYIRPILFEFSSFSSCSTSKEDSEKCFNISWTVWKIKFRRLFDENIKQE